MLPVLSLNGLNYANSYLVPISFRMLTMPWIFYPISFCRRVSCFVLFQTKVALSVFVRIKMPLLMCLVSLVTALTDPPSLARRKKKFLYLGSRTQHMNICRSKTKAININNFQGARQNRPRPPWIPELFMLGRLAAPN